MSGCWFTLRDPNGPRRVNVARMRRYQDRDRERYFWSMAGRRGVTRDGVFRPMGDNMGDSDPT